MIGLDNGIFKGIFFYISVQFSFCDSDDDNEDFSDRSETMLSGGEDDDDNVDETTWTQPVIS